MEDYNRAIIEQINQQLKSGFDASLASLRNHHQYCVVRTGVHGVLSVLPMHSVSDVDHEFGPKTFAECIHYINTYLVADIKQLTRHRHHLLRIDDEETDEENQP